MTVNKQDLDNWLSMKENAVKAYADLKEEKRKLQDGIKAINEQLVALRPLAAAHSRRSGLTDRVRNVLIEHEMVWMEPKEMLDYLEPVDSLISVCATLRQLANGKKRPIEVKKISEDPVRYAYRFNEDLWENNQ